MQRLLKLPRLGGRPDLGVFALFVAFTLGVYSVELLGGPIYYGTDTLTFYYPLTEWAAVWIREGYLPRWTPVIFGGYPLMADGEIGLLHPLNLLLLATLPVEIAYAWHRALHSLIAATGAYTLARSIGAGRIGSAIGALSFAYCSFMVGHLQHDNIIRTAVWLPWLLVAAERALRAEGPARVRWTLAGALVLGIQGLGVHVQPLLLSLLMLGAYVLVGPLGGARNAESLLAYLRSRALVGGCMVVLGLALACVQLLPLLLLGLRSTRPGLATYAYATSYSVSPPQLLTLLFPFAFHFDAERNWALWPPHESTLFVGVAPLVVALLAVRLLRSRAIAFFGVVAILSVVLSLGDYLPIKPYELISSLPGFNVLRAPGRFSLLFALSVACLAALGLDAVHSRAGSGPSRVLLVIILGGAAIVALLAASRIWLWIDPLAARDILDAVYVQTSKENWLMGPWHVYYGMLGLARADNWSTLFALGVLAVSVVAPWAWSSRPGPHGLWPAALLLVTIADLGFFATTFVSRRPIEQLRPRSAALAAIPREAIPPRVFVDPELNQTLGANQLAGLRIATINGYSSLEPGRMSAYWWSIVAQDDELADIFGVRYSVLPKRSRGQRTFDGLPYHPADRLLSGTAGSPSGVERFTIPPSDVTAIVLVGAVESLAPTVPGEAVGRVMLEAEDGASFSLEIVRGEHLDEFAIGVWPDAAESGAHVAWLGPGPAKGPGNEPAGRLYGAVVAIEPGLSRVVSVEATALLPRARLHLNALGLVGSDGRMLPITSSARAKYRQVFEDANVRVVENQAAFPRAFLVGAAIRPDPANPTVEQLATTAWDPRREAFVDGIERSRGAPSDTVGTATIRTFEPDRVVVDVQVAAPGFLVLADRLDDGWRVYVDGVEAEILRANGVARAVEVRPGARDVTFGYDPWWLQVGAAISGGALFIVAVTAIRTRARATRAVAVRTTRTVPA
jgi:hypothetical protein